VTHAWPLPATPVTVSLTKANQPNINLLQP
jgi:hypothetical protein